MSKNFPGNPWADVHSEVKRDTAGVMTSLNLLAYEQRTATLLSLLGSLQQKDQPIPDGLRSDIYARLGIES